MSGLLEQKYCTLSWNITRILPEYYQNITGDNITTIYSNILSALNLSISNIL